MPPKPIVSRDDVLNAAISLIREHGNHSVNARSIACVLNCSTKPLFRLYRNMDELKEDLYSKAIEYYSLFLKSNEIDESDVFLSIGANYIKFANEEKELFKYIYLSNNMQFRSLDELADLPDTRNIVEYLAVSAGLGKEAAKGLFLELWLLAHGVATMIATNPCTLDDREIKRLLINAFTAKYKNLKSEEHQL